MMDRKLFIKLSLLTLALAIGYLLRGFIDPDSTPATVAYPIRDVNTPYKFISPLLAYDLPKNIGESRNLQEQLDDFIAHKKATNELSGIGIYVRPVKSGGWAGINENEKFHPASLLKVPLMTAYFKWAEFDSNILQKLLTVVDLPGNSEDSLQSVSLETGEKVTVDELIRLMIVESDNLAFTTLSKNIDLNYLTEVFSDLGIGFPTTGGEPYSVSAKEYALFFRILYNSTYLNSEMSERALSLLGQAVYGYGIVAGIPGSVVVAHKYGERVTKDAGLITAVELHDCGIVYHSTNPYVLCIMSRGKNITELTNVIAEISRRVFAIMSKE